MIVISLEYIENGFFKDLLFGCKMVWKILLRVFLVFLDLIVCMMSVICFVSVVWYDVVFFL